jgi:hypothetical protein
MISKGLARFVALFAVFIATLPLQALAADHSGTSNTSSQTASAGTQNSTGNTTAKVECENGSCNYQLPHITVNNPTQAPAQWQMHERIAWVANLVLALVAYLGIMVAIVTLRKIEKQARYAEEAVTGAVDGIKSALKSLESLAASTDLAVKSVLEHAHAFASAERPWLLITVEPSLTISNCFMVTVSNRGKSPAKIILAQDQTKIAADAEHLPETPEFPQDGPEAQQSPYILIPGESRVVRSLSRDDLKGICWSKEMLRRIESWEEKVFVYGKIVYTNLAAPLGGEEYETAWCCWYIHGRQKSGLVITGSAAYNHHT